MNAYTSSLSGASTPYQYRPQSMTGVRTPYQQEPSFFSPQGIFEGLFGREAQVRDPFFQPSGETFSQLSSLLSGGGLGGVDPRMQKLQKSFGMAEGGIGQLLGGQALSQMLAPTLQRFQEQVLPQTLSQVAGRGMSRGRSAIPGYATKAAGRAARHGCSRSAGRADTSGTADSAGTSRHAFKRVSTGTAAARERQRHDGSARSHAGPDPLPRTASRRSVYGP